MLPFFVVNAATCGRTMRTLHGRPGAVQLCLLLCCRDGFLVSYTTLA